MAALFIVLVLPKLSFLLKALLVFPFLFQNTLVPVL
jgi:hypothetical protein